MPVGTYRTHRPPGHSFATPTRGLAQPTANKRMARPGTARAPGDQPLPAAPRRWRGNPPGHRQFSRPARRADHRPSRRVIRSNNAAGRAAVIVDEWPGYPGHRFFELSSIRFGSPAKWSADYRARRAFPGPTRWRAAPHRRPTDAPPRPPGRPVPPDARAPGPTWDANRPSRRAGRALVPPEARERRASGARGPGHISVNRTLLRGASRGTGARRPGGDNPAAATRGP
jgi:hypothetical protein